MTTPRFIQIHWLTSYPAALLNRDDAGLAKRMSFGGITRARISSQCLKRHWRVADDAWNLSGIGVPMGSRSKEVVERLIMPGAAGPDWEDRAEAKAVAEVFIEELYGKKAKDKKNRQALFFGEPEIAFLTDKARAFIAGANPQDAAKTFFKEERANMREQKNSAGLESALFGRMVTSDTAANTDAAIHVAHALTVHGIERELDFVTAVDDLKDRAEGDDSGAAGVFDMELTSGLYYGYTVVDVDLLVRNLANDADVAGKVVEHLIHLIAEVSPGAKKGSTAPYAKAEIMLVELGDRQPRTLANAFRNAVPLKSNRLFEDAVDRLAGHLAALDAAYASGEARRALNLSDIAIPNSETSGMDDLAAWAGAAVRNAGAAA